MITGISWRRATRRTSVALLAAGFLALPGCAGSDGLRTTPLESPAAAAPQSADPALAVVPGTTDVVMSWIGGDGREWALYVARSSDAGEQWTPPVKVAEGPGEVHPHGESSPRLVVASGGRMALAWPSSITVPGRKWPATMMRFARSGDGGRTWSEPITLNDDTTRARVSHQFHGAAWIGDSGLAVAWLDERHAGDPIATGADGHADHGSEPDATIYLASSEDFGGTWAPSNRRGWGAACPCCRVSLARAPDGGAVAAWRKHFPGHVRDVVTAPIGGDRNQEPTRVYADEWSYPGCPHSGPALAVGHDGAQHVVWFNGREGDAGVYYARSPSGAAAQERVGLVTGSGLSTAHPAVAALPDGGALAAWDINEDGERRISVARVQADGSLDGSMTVPGPAEGKYPQLAVVGDSVALVAWTSTTGDVPRMSVARLRWR